MKLVQNPGFDARAPFVQPPRSRPFESNVNPTVAPGIRARVLAALEGSGHVPNAKAKAMRTAKSGAIGLVRPEIQNPFLPYLVDALTGVVAERDLTTTIVE